MKLKTSFTYIMLLMAALAFSQEEDKKYLPKGNRQYKDKEYASAEANYRIAQSQNQGNNKASYNLGNAIYRQGQEIEAAYAYLKAVEGSDDKALKHKAYHNIGNVLMKTKDYQKAVEAYKNALRNNPYDEETRYNFALAKKMLKENPPKPQPPKDQNKDQKDKQDKSQQPKDQGGGGGGDDKDKGDKGDQKDKDNNKDKGDQKDKSQGKDKEDKAGDGGEQEQDGPSPGRQRMENLLDAMNNEEKKIQDKVNARKVKVQPKQPEKDW